jgi:hypothetical protein
MLQFNMMPRNFHEYTGEGDGKCQHSRCGFGLCYDAISNETMLVQRRMVGRIMNAELERNIRTLDGCINPEFQQRG